MTFVPRPRPPVAPDFSGVARHLERLADAVGAARRAIRRGDCAALLESLEAACRCAAAARARAWMVGFDVAEAERR